MDCPEELHQIWNPVPLFALPRGACTKSGTQFLYSPHDRCWYLINDTHIQKWRLKNVSVQDWEDSLVVMITDCLSRGPGCHAQHPHGNSKLSLTPVPWAPVASPGTISNAHTWYRDTQAGKTNKQIFLKRASQSIFCCSQHNSIEWVRCKEGRWTLAQAPVWV